MINIEIICNHDYSKISRVMLYSLFVNNKDSVFRIFLLTDSSWTSKDTDELTRFVNHYHSTIDIIHIDESLLSGFPTTFLPVLTYFRLLSATILPETVEKVLYMDVDTLVSGNINALWETELDNYAVAAIPDCDERYCKERLGLPIIKNYVNAGILLCNLKYWREHKIQEIFFQTKEEYKSVLKFMDQDVINIALHDKIKLLPPKYNLEIWGLSNNTWAAMDLSLQEDYRRAVDDPIIIHYANIPKPWDVRYYYGLPFSRIWIRHWWRSGQFGAVKFKPFHQYVILLIKLITRIRLFSGMKKYFVKDFWGYY